MREIKYEAFLKNKNFMCDVLEINLSDKIVWVEYAPDSISFLPFDDVEIRQFTWLLDKNGKEIYEGDIVYSKHSLLNYEVKFWWHNDEWGNVSYGYWVKIIDDPIENNWETLFNSDLFLEVVWNIHENWELLTK